jgi:hypothetical protein
MNEARRLFRSGLWLAAVSMVIGAARTSAAQEPSGERRAQSEAQEPSRERPSESEEPADEQPTESVDERPWSDDETLPEEQDETDDADAGSKSRTAARAEEAQSTKRPTKSERAKTSAAKKAPPLDPRSLGPPRTPWGIEVGVGPLVAWVPDDRFDLFSDSGSWPALAARISGSVWSSGSFDVAVSSSYHFATTSGDVRETPTELSLHRFLVGAQGRHRLLPWLAPYSRVLAGFSYLTSQLGSGAEDEVPKLSSFDFSALASAGAQARIIELARSGLILHLYVEGGGIFTASTGLVYRSGSGGPPRSQPIDVGTVSLSGPHLETGAMARF